MKLPIATLVVVAAAAVAAVRAVQYPSPPIDRPEGSWNYDTEDETNGPDAWTDTWPRCGNGEEQSPINVNTETVVEDLALGNLEFDLTEVQWEIFSAATQSSRSHTWSPSGVQQDNGSVTWGSTTYWLRQVRFHHRAEHQLDGVEHAFEVEFLFKEWGGAWLAYSVLGLEGGENAAFPSGVTYDGTNDPADLTWDPSGLVPADGSYLTYPGSLSTPACEEDVIRIVAWKQTWASASQIAAVIRGGAYVAAEDRVYRQTRGVQPYHARTVRFHQHVYAPADAISSCTAVSRFFENADWWNTHTSEEKEIVALSHESGKYIAGSPRTDVETTMWRFAAKPAFRGDVRHAYNGGQGVLRLRLQVCAHADDLSANVDESGDIVITGNDHELVHHFSYLPSKTHFTQYAVGLDTASWGLRSVLTPDATPTTPSESELLDVLSYVKCIGVRGRWTDRFEVPVYLDDPEPIAVWKETDESQVNPLP
jgi:carbonic anhydrase